MECLCTFSSKIMASHNVPQLSLVAKFDDLCRHTKSLTEGCEKEFKQFVESQKRLLKKKKDAEAELESLRKKVASFAFEKQKYETQLKHMKNAFMSEVEQRKRFEQEKSSLERQIALIKDVLLTNGNTMDNQTKKRLVQLSSVYKHPGGSPSRLTTIEESMGSLLSASECDESEEDISIGVTHRKRRSKGRKYSGELTQKKRKSEGVANHIFLDDAFGNGDIRKNTVNFAVSSDPNSTSPDIPTPRPIYRSESEQIRDSPCDLLKINVLDYNGSTPSGRYSLGNRSHAFVAKTVIRTEKCYPCGRVVKFCKQVLKCNNCRITCHPECKEQCPKQCISATSTPTKGLMGDISDYAPSEPPMIPSLIVHCVNKIEASGLNEVGLYRISGSDREVKDLKEKFLRGKSIPSLNDVDIHAVCGTIKEFLRTLKDTLITKASRQTFVNAANNHDENQSFNMLFSAVCDLPQPNRDTLSFLVLHLKRIAAVSECKMPVESLAKIFGPTIVGYSASEPRLSNMHEETSQQYRVVERLLRIPADSWQNLLNDETDKFHTPMRTPESTPAPVTSRLGPILTSNQKSKNTPVMRTPLKARTPRTAPKVGKRQFFTSPLLK